ncbi:MAG: patatin-like phospholipase family protein [Leptospiraceae bacterium]|nr:patatin-like phospholipase family protein [Leptospiraceae bacterium]
MLNFPNIIPKKTEYEISLAVAGGGCKAFYALGVGYKMRSWGIKFKAMSGVSAGAAMILGILSENEESSFEYLESLVRRNESNFEITRLLKGERPFPHENMYRRTIRYSLEVDKVQKSGVKIFIQAVAAFPKQQKDKLGDLVNKAKIISQTAQAYLLDEADKIKGKECDRVKKIIEKWNLKEFVYTEKDLKDESIVEQIILNSSSIPPVVAFQNKDDLYFMDGGLINNLLLEVFPLRHKKIGIYYDGTSVIGKNKKVLENTLLIKPSRNLSITTFDYTNPEGLKDTYELGKNDAENLKSKILEFCKKDN